MTSNSKPAAAFGFLLQTEPVALSEKFAVRSAALRVNSPPVLKRASLEAVLVGDCPANPGLVPVGSVEFCRAWMAACAIELPAPMDYPDCLRPYLHREVHQTTVRRARPGWFIKPRQTKVFTGGVLTDAELSDLPPDLAVWASEPVRWQAEYRCYVLSGVLHGVSRYDGGPDDAEALSAQNQTEVQAMIATLATQPDTPIAYSLDVGILDTGALALVECNDAWALGYYRGSMTASTYAQMLAARWVQIRIASLVGNSACNS